VIWDRSKQDSESIFSFADYDMIFPTSFFFQVMSYRRHGTEHWSAVSWAGANSHVTFYAVPCEMREIALFQTQFAYWLILQILCVSKFNIIVFFCCCCCFVNRWKLQIKQLLLSNLSQIEAKKLSILLGKNFEKCIQFSFNLTHFFLGNPQYF